MGCGVAGVDVVRCGVVSPRRCALFALLTLLGCGTGATPDGGLASDVPSFDGSVDVGGEVLVLGTGQTQWESLNPSGNRMELIHGPQGGYHVFGRARFRTLPPPVYLSFRVTPVVGGPPVNLPTDRYILREGRGLVRLGPDLWETSNAMLVVLTAIRGPQDVVGRRFTLEMTVQRAEGPETVSGSVEVEIVDDT